MGKYKMAKLKHICEKPFPIFQGFCEIEVENKHEAEMIRMVVENEWNEEVELCDYARQVATKTMKEDGLTFQNIQEQLKTLRCECCFEAVLLPSDTDEYDSHTGKFSSPRSRKERLAEYCVNNIEKLKEDRWTQMNQIETAIGRLKQTEREIEILENKLKSMQKEDL